MLNKINKPTKILLAASLSASIGAYAVLASKIILEAGEDFDGELDYLFVLGGLIIGEETPSEHLLKRIEKAAVYLNKHPDTVAVTCGGCFRNGQKKSEALIIKEHLVSRGISEKRIILEDKSTTTNENFLFGKEIVKNHSKKEFYELSTGFLSSDYHLYRADIIAQINGLKGLKKIGAKSGKDFIRGALRELLVAPGVIKNYIDNL